MLTKDDLSQIKIVVREVIQPEIEALKQSTKKDMKGLETRFTGNMKGLEKRLTERFDESQMEIVAAVDKHKADKEDVKVLEKRVDRLEDNAGLPPFPTQ